MPVEPPDLPEGAVALTYTPAIADAAELRKQYSRFVQLAAESGHRPIALGSENSGSLALVHFWDGRLSSGRLDIDPAFLIHDGNAWKLLAEFGHAELSLAYRTEQQNVALSKLMRDHSRVSSKLREKYAPMFESSGSPP